MDKEMDNQETVLTAEEAEAAIQQGRSVMFNAEGIPVRILTEEEERKEAEEWDAELFCPKKFSELYRRMRERLKPHPKTSNA